MLTDSQGLAVFYASVGEEGKRSMAAGPLLTGGELPWKTLHTDASIARLNFTLPETLVMQIMTTNEPDDGPIDAHLSWLFGEGSIFEVQTGGQFLPLASKNLRIGGLVPGKKVSWKLTALGRVDTRLTTKGDPTDRSMTIAFGDKLSTVLLRVVDGNGRPFPPQLIGVIATPVSSKPIHLTSAGAGLSAQLKNPPIRTRPETVRKVVGGAGSLDFQLVPNRAYLLKFFVRRGVAGDFGGAHRFVKSVGIDSMKPGSFRDRGDIVLRFPSVEVRGEVLDIQGAPVPGARVELSSIYFPHQALGKKKVNKKFIKSTTVVTDADGKFLIYLGQKRGRGYTLKASQGSLKSEQVLVDENSSPLQLIIH